MCLHNQSIGIEINTISYFCKPSCTLWIWVTLSSHSSRKQHCLEGQNRRRKKHNYHVQPLSSFWTPVLAALLLMDARPPATPWGVLRHWNMLPDAICLMLWRYCQHNDKVSCSWFPLKQQRCEEYEWQSNMQDIVCGKKRQKKERKKTMTGSKTTVANE